MTNVLYLGREKNIELPHGGFLYIDDDVPQAPQSRIFDPRTHSLNPLKGLEYKAARQLSNVLYDLYPQGENTLTVRNGKRGLLPALLKADRFDRIEGDEEIEGMVTDILQSPVLRKVLCNPTNFSFNPNSRIFARINRAELGEFDALCLTFVLMAFYKGQLIIPDFGFYGRDAHTNLVREKRLICGLNYLDEVSLHLKRTLLLVPDIRAHHVLYDDAVTLAKMDGTYTKDQHGFSDLVTDAMGSGL